MLPLFKCRLSPYWWVRLARPHGRAARESTKIPWDAPTADQRKKNRALAEAVYFSRMGDRARQRNDLPAADPERLTLGAWLRWYETHIVPTHRGADRELRALERWRDALGRLDLADVTRAAVNEWITRRAAVACPPAKRPPAPVTINREVDILKSALRSAVDHGKLAASPLVGMKRLHTTTPNRRVMTRDEEARLLTVLAPHDRALLLMGLDTLCRLGDCLDLKWEHDHGDTLWIPDPKAGAGFAVPVTARLRKALDVLSKEASKGCSNASKGTSKECSNGSLYVFELRRRPETDSQRRAGVSHMLRRACAKCDPPVPYGRASGGLTFHWSTRRTAATRMLLAGVPLPTVQRAGHWATAAMVLDIYAQTVDSEVREAVEGISGYSRGLRRRTARGKSSKPGR